MKLNVALCIHPQVEHYNVVKMAIEEEGDLVKIYSQETQVEQLESDKIDFIVSYGYRYLLKGNILDRYDKKSVNFHPSFLPWGRGYNPNLWSQVFDFPTGVTLHNINSGIDTGDILCNRQHVFDESETLRTSYYNLQTSMLSLFAKSWRDIRINKITREVQNLDDGNLFYKKHGEAIFHLLEKGWDTSLKELYSLRGRIKEELDKQGYGPRKSPPMPTT